MLDASGTFRVGENRLVFMVLGWLKRQRALCTSRASQLQLEGLQHGEDVSSFESAALNRLVNWEM